jgi:hypothetical protein
MISPRENNVTLPLELTRYLVLQNRAAHPKSLQAKLREAFNLYETQIYPLTSNVFKTQLVCS